MPETQMQIKCIDGSYLDLNHIRETERQIEFYRKFVKEGNSFDTFYEKHLVVLETGLELLKELLQKQETRSSIEENDIKSEPVEKRKLRSLVATSKFAEFGLTAEELANLVYSKPLSGEQEVTIKKLRASVQNNKAHSFNLAQDRK